LGKAINEFLNHQSKDLVGIRKWGFWAAFGSRNWLSVLRRIKDTVRFNMPLRPLKTFFPDADDIANCELPTLGATLLAHLKSYEGLNTVYQYAGLNRTYFRAMLENHNVGLGPMPKESEYGPRQAEVAQAMLEAFNWLVREGHLIPNSQQPTGDWFTISRSGEKLLQQQARETQWEKLGVDVV
jgi:hypothetical protein